MKFLKRKYLDRAGVLRDVEKLFPAKFAKNKIAPGCVMSDLLESQDIFYPRNFDHLRRKVSFSTPTGFFAN
jgi:hypothetical protein